MINEKTKKIANAQIKQTVRQELDGVTIRMATIACPCGIERALVACYRCLYCGVWFCTGCAEHHFGKTIEDFQKEEMFH